MMKKLKKRVSKVAPAMAAILLARMLVAYRLVLDIPQRVMLSLERSPIREQEHIAQQKFEGRPDSTVASASGASGRALSATIASESAIQASLSVTRAPSVAHGAPS